MRSIRPHWGHEHGRVLEPPFLSDLPDAFEFIAIMLSRLEMDVDEFIFVIYRADENCLLQDIKATPDDPESENKSTIRLCEAWKCNQKGDGYVAAPS